MLVAKGSVWKYLDNGSDQGTAWQLPSFDDTAWTSGTAPLGYGDPMTTTISAGQMMSSIGAHYDGGVVRPGPACAGTLSAGLDPH